MKRILGIAGMIIFQLGAQAQLSLPARELPEIDPQTGPSAIHSPWGEPAEKGTKHFFSCSGITFGPMFSQLSKGWGKANRFGETNSKWFLAYPNSKIGFGVSVFGEHSFNKRFLVRSELNLLNQNQQAHYKKESQLGATQTIDYYKYTVSTFQVQVPVLFGLNLGNPEDVLLSLHAGPAINAMVFNRSKGESLQYVTQLDQDTTYINQSNPEFEHEVTRFFGTLHYSIAAHFTINERPVRLELMGSSVLTNLLKQPSYSSRSWGLRVIIPFNSFF